MNMVLLVRNTHTEYQQYYFLESQYVCVYIYAMIYICNDCLYIYMHWYIYIYAMIYIYMQWVKECAHHKNVWENAAPYIVPRGAVTCAGAIRLSYQVVVLISTVSINQSIQQLGCITTCSLWHLPWITVWVLAANYTKPYRELSNHTDTHGRSTVRRFHIQVNCQHVAHVTKRDVLVTPPHAESQTCIHTVYRAHTVL
jgi:hypothetical protein